jgi:hypothetical protein
MDVNVRIWCVCVRIVFAMSHLASPKNTPLRFRILSFLARALGRLGTPFEKLAVQIGARLYLILRAIVGARPLPVLKAVRAVVGFRPRSELASFDS